MSPSRWQQLARSSWLFFPFTSASPHDNKDAQQQQSTGGRGGTGNADASSSPHRSPRSSVLLRTPPPPPPPLVELGLDLDTNAAIALAFLLGSATTLGASIVYRRFFKRIRNAEWVTPDLLKRKRWITGIVTRCVCYTAVFPQSNP
jgi:hypothetical protein